MSNAFLLIPDEDCRGRKHYIEQLPGSTKIAFSTICKTFNQSCSNIQLLGQHDHNRSYCHCNLQSALA